MMLRRSSDNSSLREVKFTRGDIEPLLDIFMLSVLFLCKKTSVMWLSKQLKKPELKALHLVISKINQCT